MHVHIEEHHLVRLRDLVGLCRLTLALIQLDNPPLG